MGWQSDLLAGIATHLHDRDVGTWRASGAYLPSDVVPIVITAQPGTPDRIITLTGYGVSDDPALNDSLLGVQVRARGTTDPRTVDDLADRVFDALHGLATVTLGGVPVVQVYRVSFTPLGPDGNRRFEQVANYYVQATRPSPHRPD